MTLQDLSTPALLLDVDIFESNLRFMADRVSAAGKALRPHAKAHKCVEVARRQIEAGAVGVCVATVDEAEVMVRAGVSDILLTSPIAGARKCSRLAALAQHLSVVVDHAEQIALYDAAAQRAGSQLGVLVDLDVGDHRTGVSPGQPVVRLAEQVLASHSLIFRGLQAYSVRASHLHEADNRAEYSAKVLAPAAETKALLERRGIETALVTGSSTGTYQADCDSPFLTELQPGSYVLMDVAYARIGGIQFGHALTVAATVVSANHPDRVTVDAGFKAFSTDRPFGPEALDLPGSRYEWAGDEFGFVYLEDAPRRVRLGDRLRFIPPHCDPTVNLYDRLHVCRGEEVLESWPVMDRTASHRTYA
jgi:D-serine deaminase-like pyridoxal phosphate-dependent protein